MPDEELKRQAAGLIDEVSSLKEAALTSIEVTRRSVDTVRSRTRWLIAVSIVGGLLALSVLFLVIRLKTVAHHATEAAEAATKAAEAAKAQSAANKVLIQNHHDTMEVELKKSADGLACYAALLTGKPAPDGVTCPSR